MLIRDAFPSDATEIARLTAELGYAATPDEIAERLSRGTDPSKQVVYVALMDERIAGWVQAQATEILESGFRVEIVGLIVSGDFRRRGVGRRLVEAAEQWAIECSAPALVVRSNAQRVESHRFYPALGFTTTKTQNVYRKPLPPPRPPS